MKRSFSTSIDVRVMVFTKFRPFLSCTPNQRRLCNHFNIFSFIFPSQRTVDLFDFYLCFYVLCFTLASLSLGFHFHSRVVRRVLWHKTSVPFMFFLHEIFAVSSALLHWIWRRKKKQFCTRSLGINDSNDWKLCGMLPQKLFLFTPLGNSGLMKIIA